jgi:hypothetical protein
MMREMYAAVMDQLGQEDGYLLPWSIVGCQVVSPGAVRRLLSCDHWEAINQCEVIGPHKVHRWSDHTISHERFGNGYACWSIGDGRDSAGRLLMPGGYRGTALHVVGVTR